MVSLVQDGTVVKQEMLGREDFESGNCMITVSRKPTMITVFTGITSMNLLEGRKLDIKSENQCDELFSSSSTADLTGESMEYLVSLHKNFARLFLTVYNLKEGMTLGISGKVSGYNLLDAAPYEGAFNCLPEGDKDTRDYCIRLPRQLDDDLFLNVMTGGETVRSIALGSLIASSGYSFKDEDLRDITLTVDLEKSYAALMIEGWDQEEIPLIEY